MYVLIKKGSNVHKKLPESSINAEIGGKTTSKNLRYIHM